MEVIRLNAGNDRNGNPRRVYVFIQDGDIRAVADEGYEGRAAMTSQWHGLRPDAAPASVPTFATTAGEYRDLKRNYS